ncbi:hypothetical protein OF820_06835 [Oceanotoga sp. DSM 15011]|jgi:hypothetical protein|uniref:Uncharacterized protein n=1 Tax=Oceanotoga teriensis TaxID=515440 RepID=A0AA45C5J9_9BACT|nr:MULTISPECIES: hypothetical protein [Oceanotoga]MDN5343425.1 hypothetical protein [Oceanotoga sp.]MDO7976424.1 hypothetical protein [Oceanotoga teriensis]PWJ89036.1 hypothetical protein C7380_11649 [Oceanotoga teriensis]UYP01400.1 hypothetical protein OF820_06835 [Oceanotoga sp. DSM 15011]
MDFKVDKVEPVSGRTIKRVENSYEEDQRRKDNFHKTLKKEIKKLKNKKEIKIIDEVILNDDLERSNNNYSELKPKIIQKRNTTILFLKNNEKGSL